MQKKHSRMSVTSGVKIICVNSAPNTNGKLTPPIFDSTWCWEPPYMVEWLKMVF